MFFGGAVMLILASFTGEWRHVAFNVRTGSALELEWCDLEEVLLQTAIYAGVPAANTGFHAAAAETDAGGDPVK